MAAAWGGYVIVLHTAEEGAPPGFQSDAAYDEAVELRRLSNDLIEVANTVFEDEGAAGSIGAGHNRWYAERLLPQADALWRRMMDAEHRSPALARLLDASQKLAALGSRPDSVELRRSARRAVLEAVEAAETRIQALGAAGRLREPARKPGFAEEK